MGIDASLRPAKGRDNPLLRIHVRRSIRRQRVSRRREVSLSGPSNGRGECESHNGLLIVEVKVLPNSSLVRTESSSLESGELPY